MLSARNINRKAFCLLAGIPDIWMRTQTSRATDLLVNLNTRYCQSGRSTIARVCALSNKSCYELPLAISYLQGKKAPLKGQARVSQTIKYLHQLEITLACPQESNPHPPVLASEIAQVLESKQLQNAIIYTDGSTKARTRDPNSGCGIYVTTLTGAEVWSGGCIVRTDGNNFLAEIAAVSIVIMGCPENLPLTIRTDSLATIGALSQGTVSERKRIRAAGRPWLNWCRQSWHIKRQHIKLEHVASHQDFKNAASTGNDKADALANLQRALGETQNPQPYFTLKEEKVILKHGDNNIQGDVRGTLKEIERKAMLAEWTSLKTQGQLVKKFPTQVLKQAKRVWKEAILRNEGQAWVYYIFAACNWLPTNYRLFSKIPNLLYRTSCVLCTGNKLDTMTHLLECPSLSMEQRALAVGPQQRYENGASRKYLLQPEVSSRRKMDHCWEIYDRSFDRLALMAQDFFHTNYRKQSGTRLFLKHCQRALSQNIIPDLPRSLLQILSVEFKLSVEGISNVLSHQELFPDWCSNDPADKWFGARKCALEEDFSGYFNCINETKEFTEQLLARLFQALDSQRPTRAVIVAPLTFLAGRNHTLLLPLCTLNWDRELSQEHSPKLSVVLALNKESMLIDPIFWTAFCVKLREWSHQNRVPATIPERTDWLFKERRNPDRQARMVTIPLPEIETTPYPFHAICTGQSQPWQ